MTPKEKADKLINNYHSELFDSLDRLDDDNNVIRDAAIVCANEIIIEYQTIDPSEINDLTVGQIEYWQGVIYELKKY